MRQIGSEFHNEPTAPLRTGNGRRQEGGGAGDLFWGRRSYRKFGTFSSKTKEPPLGKLRSPSLKKDEQKIKGKTLDRKQSSDAKTVPAPKRSFLSTAWASGSN